MNEFLLTFLPSKLEQILLGIGGVFGFVVGWAMNGIADAFYWLFAFVCVDYLTGMYQAGKNKVWSSSQGFKGLLKKFLILTIAVLSHGLAKMIELPAVETAVMFAFALNEFGSILENIEKAGYGAIIPLSIRKILEIVEDKGEKAIEKLK